jgi:hypothetical protein
LVIVLASASAQAAPANLTDEQRAQAREHYSNGTKKFNVAKFDEAAAEFVAAYEIAGEASLLYNIAQSYRMAEQHEKALFFFKSFLRQLPAGSPIRAEVEKRIGELTIAVQEAKRAASSLPAGTIKPEQLSQPEPKPETKPATKPEAKPEAKPEVKPETKPETPPEARVETPPETKPETKPETPPKAPSASLKWAGVGLLALGVVSVGVGAGMSAAAAHDSSLLEQAGQKGVAFGPSLQAAQKNGPLYDTLSYVFYGVGAAAAVAGAVTLVMGLRKPPASQRAQLAPVVSSNTAGLVLTGSF